MYQYLTWQSHPRGHLDCMDNVVSVARADDKGCPWLTRLSREIPLSDAKMCRKNDPGGAPNGSLLRYGRGEVNPSP